MLFLSIFINIPISLFALYLVVHLQQGGDLTSFQLADMLSFYTDFPQLIALYFGFIILPFEGMKAFTMWRGKPYNLVQKWIRLTILHLPWIIIVIASNITQFPYYKIFLFILYCCVFSFTIAGILHISGDKFALKRKQAESTASVPSDEIKKRLKT